MSPPSSPIDVWACCLDLTANSDKFCDKESGVRKVVLRGSIRNVVMAQQLIMDLVWEEMETAIGVMQFMIPDEVIFWAFLLGRMFSDLFSRFRKRMFGNGLTNSVLRCYL